MKYHWFLIEQLHRKHPQQGVTLRAGEFTHQRLTLFYRFRETGQGFALSTLFDRTSRRARWVMAPLPIVLPSRGAAQSPAASGSQDHGVGSL